MLLFDLKFWRDSPATTAVNYILEYQLNFKSISSISKFVTIHNILIDASVICWDLFNMKIFKLFIYSQLYDLWWNIVLYL